MSDDLEHRVFKRFDADGELEHLLGAFRPLAGNRLARGVLTLLTGGKVDIGAFESTGRQIDQLMTTMADALLLFTPLGWAPTAFAPTDVYDRALRAYRTTGAVDQVEDILVSGWNEEGRLESRPNHLVNFGQGDEELEEFFRARHVLVRKAIAHHRNKAYEASVLILLAQADGITLQITGKQLFVQGRPKHVVDNESIAGLPEGLQVLAPLFAASQKETTISDELSRHGILHGLQLGYDTKVNSTKCVVLLMAVMDWAEPKVKRMVEIRHAEREARYAGIVGRDTHGRWLDRRGFKAAKRSLEWLSMVQGTRLRTTGRFESDIAALPPEPHDAERVEQRKVILHSSDDGLSYVGARQVESSGFWFGIAERIGPPRLYYAAAAVPPTEMSSEGWTADPPVDWERDD
jgi:hypothetical protein